MRAPLLLLPLLALACAPRHAPPGPEQAPLRFVVDLRVEVDSHWRRVESRRVEVLPGAPLPAGPAGGGPASAEQDAALEAALAPLRGGGFQARLELELSLAREFHDGSQGWLLHVARAVQGPLDGPAPDSPWALAGRSVELRSFPDGEVLTVDLAEHWVGPGRQGQALDLVFPMLSPHAPEIAAGASVEQSDRWPLMIANNRGWRHLLNARWTNLGMGPLSGEDPRPAWSFRYAGETATRGGDKEALPPLGVLGRGALEGELWLDTVDSAPLPARVLRHRASWSRQLEVEFPGAPGGPVRVSQDWRITAELQRVAP